MCIRAAAFFQPLRLLLCCVLLLRLPFLPPGKVIGGAAVLNCIHSVLAIARMSTNAMASAARSPGVCEYCDIIEMQVKPHHVVGLRGLKKCRPGFPPRIFLHGGKGSNRIGYMFMDDQALRREVVATPVV